MQRGKRQAWIIGNSAKVYYYVEDVAIAASNYSQFDS